MNILQRGPKPHCNSVLRPLHLGFGVEGLGFGEGFRFWLPLRVLCRFYKGVSRITRRALSFGFGMFGFRG